MVLKMIIDRPITSLWNEIEKIKKSRYASLYYFRKNNIKAKPISMNNICSCGCNEKCSNKFKRGHYLKLNPFLGKDNPASRKETMTKIRMIRWNKTPQETYRKGLINRGGYLCIYLLNHPKTWKDNYYLYHRYIYEKYLKRFLNNEEIIHHIDGNRLNNHITNLRRFKNINVHSKSHYDHTIINDKGRFVGGGKNP